MIENGFVHLPGSASWLAQYLPELTSFPKGRHDDQVDSTAQVSTGSSSGGGPSVDAGIWHLHKERYEAQPEPISVLAKRLDLLRW